MIFRSSLKSKTIIRVLLLVGTFIFVTMSIAPVFAFAYTVQNGLPAVSGQTVMDTDPEGGYEGDFVLVYNNSLDATRAQPTGTLTNIDTTQMSTMSRELSAVDNDRIDYHPEALMLDSAYHFSLFQPYTAGYSVGDTKEFRIMEPISGRTKNMAFTLLYSGANCYVWAPAINTFMYSQESIDLENEEEHQRREEDVSENFKEPEEESEQYEFDSYEEYIEYIENQSKESEHAEDAASEVDLSVYNSTLNTAYGDERDYRITLEMAQEAGSEFDGFYNTMTTNFGAPVDADGTGKISLLMYDIQDGNNTSSYIGGFFSSGDLYRSGNATSMLHIDTYPSVYSPYTSSPKISKAFSTMVHEFQHLLNYSRYYQNVENGQVGARPMDTWLNEAMSMAAEEMVFPESALPMRKDYYNRDYYGKIRSGKSMLQFDNSLESYSLSSLFAAYIRNQTGGYEIFSNILNNYIGDEKAAIEASLLGTSLEGMIFEDLMAAYRIALVRNDSKGLYGFKGDSLIDNIKLLNYNRQGQSVQLPGGASIVIKTRDGVFYPSSGVGSDIRFAGIKIAEDGVTITAKPKNLTMMVGESFELEAVATILGADRSDITWSSSDPQVASSDGTGNSKTLTALREGSAEIIATCDGFEDSFRLSVFTAPNISDFEGLTIENGDIYITSTQGMYAFERLVNGVTPVGMTDGLDGYNIYLMTSVDVANWTPIGTAAKPFKGNFEGNGFKIVLRGLKNEAFVNAGVFGYNLGTIQNTTVDLRGDMAGSNVGALVGTNNNEIINPVVNIDQGVSVKGNVNAGGVAGYNQKNIENASVVNHGTIGSVQAGSAGGVAGKVQGVNAGDIARIDGADVYNNGTIISSDDTGGIAGLLHGWRGRGAILSGRLNLIVTKNGEVTSTDSFSASVGGAIGYAYDRALIENATITLRLDGKILSKDGNGKSGGVIGECGSSSFANTKVIVTLGPEAVVSQTSSGDYGLIFGERIWPNLDDVIYAVPYDTVAEPLPSGSIYNSQVKRIEYPKEGNPTPTIEVNPDSDNNIKTPANMAGNGIFIPKIGITDLAADAAVDTDLFNLNTAAQTLCSKAEAAPNYFDFNIVADGLPITIPAYLDLNNPDIPIMTFEMIGAHAEDTIAAAKENPAEKTEAITISCVNGRVPNDDWTLKWLQGDVFKDYKPNQYISTDTLTKKQFTLNEFGLYEISATASAIYDNTKQKLVKYVHIADPSIMIEGEHLTNTLTEEWTNLKKENDAVSPAALRALPETGKESVLIKSINTTIEKNDFKKEAISYHADLEAEIKNHAALPIERSFTLYETGRYKIAAKGAGVDGEIVRYVNIDVDNPMPTVLKGISGTVIYGDTDYEVVLPIENMEQSPIHGEYSIDSGAFAPLPQKSIRLSSQNKTLDLKTVDAATNESTVTRYTLNQPTSSGSGKSRGTKTKRDGLPYYYKDNNMKENSSTAKKIFIGIADKLDGEMNYIAPPEKTVYFINNPKYFKDIQGHWGKEEIDFVTEREIFVGTKTEEFSPDADMTRGMFAAVIGRMYERSYRPVTTGIESKFNDVPTGYYYTDYVNWAAANGIILGVGENNFEPERSITREEMGVIMYRFAKFLNLSKDTSQVQLTFADTDMVSDWAIESSKYCQETGLIQGRGLNHFEPEETAHRAEVSTVIHRFVDELLRN